MTSKAYFGDINGGSLLLTDARQVASLLLQMQSEEEWNHALKDQNILQRRSIPTALRTAATIRTRLSNFNESFIRAVSEADSPEYQQLLMASLVQDSPIVADFLRFHVRETARVYKTEISKDMWWELVETARRRFEDFRYSESTLEKMGKNLFRALAEGGYIESVKSKHLQRVYLSPHVKQLIDNSGHGKLVEILEWAH